MSHSEFLEWLEFLSLPTEQELQLAQIALMISSFVGIKGVDINTFLINKLELQEQKRELTAEDINKIAGVVS